MAPRQPSPSPGADESRASPAPAPAPEAQTAEGLRTLGEALKARAGDVLSGTITRSMGSGEVVDDAVQNSFERICTGSTMAVAQWITGDGVAAAERTRREVWRVFGELAAHRAASLNEVTRRCLCWRDAVTEVLNDSARRAGAAPKALAEAIGLVQQSLELSLVRMCECFEAERQRTDEELTRREEELAFLATHDALTGLPNRTLIVDRVKQMLARSVRSQTPVAALFIDLDNFKGINDTLGHEVGDELLRAVAERLDGVVRGEDALGRLGGDEFVVISDGLGLLAGPEMIAERVLDALKHPFNLQGSQGRLTVTASVGIAIGERTSAEELLRDADIAMYRAKWDGKSRYVVFETGMEDTIQNRMELEMDLRDALGKDEFFLVYQPTFALSDMSPIGVEALIRWKHPTRGVLQPEDFIPLLEETGLITEIGRWVLGEACSQGAAWRKAGYEIGMAVNVSGRQLDSDQLIGDIEQALSDSGLDPAALTIELTETMLMRNVEQTATRLEAAKQLGVRIAIDDFGTGYSSLAHLQRFPVDALKIDRSFISGLSQNDQGETLIRTLVQLGKALSIETFAEGIEQHHELSMLRDEDCAGGQGFLYARPLDALATEAFLLNWSETGAVVLSAPRDAGAVST